MKNVKLKKKPISEIKNSLHSTNRLHKRKEMVCYIKRSQQKLSKIAEEKKNKNTVHPRLSIVDMPNDNSKRNRTDENHLQK